MFCRNLSKLFSSTTGKPQPLAAYKFMRSISSTALLYKPSAKRHLPEQESISDRVVQAFFDTTKVPILVY